MRPHRVAGSAFAGATLGLLAALANGTPLLSGLAGGLLVGELAALLAPHDPDDGGLAEKEIEEGVDTAVTPHVDPVLVRG